MAGDKFTFKQFEVRQDACAMKVGTDGVLLGAWASGGKRILDIGTGTGLIAMMMAQRFADATVVAIDIDHGSCLQAIENVENSVYKERIEVQEKSLQDFHTEQNFDCIVSNPPFFQNSLRNPDQQRATARHADALPYRVLFACVASLLTDDGVFSAVIPADSANDFIAEAYLHGLTTLRRCDIRTTARKQPRRCLLAFTKKVGNTTEHTEQVLQQADGQRSEWYSALTADFYIR